MRKTGKKVPCKTLGMGNAIAGAAGIILGFVLFYFLDPAMFYDLGLYVMIAGAALLVYGLYQIFANRNHGKSIEISLKAGENFLAHHAIMMILLVMSGVIMFIQPRFMQLQVLLDILTQSSTKIIAALGMSLTILSGGIDLSAGRMAGLAAVISTSMLQTADYANRFYPDLPQMVLIVPLIAAVLVCVLFGALNGFLVAKFDMNPFIATLAVQMIIYGINSLYFSMAPNKSQPIGGIRPELVFLGHHKLFKTGGFPGISILIPIAVFFVFLVWFILNKTKFGKNVRLIGGNKEAAAIAGVSVFSVTMCIFILASVLYSVAGILEAARTATATNNYGSGYEIDAIAACLVGGVSLKGGVGKVSGVVSGVLIFTVIQYGLSFLAVNPMWQQVITGIIIAVSAAIDLSKHSPSL